MAVIVKYVVVRDGKEDMTFTTKREAEAHDKMLDVAEQLQTFLQAAEVDVPEDALENLTFFMAKNRDELGKLLKGGRLKTPAGSAKSATPPEAKEEREPAKGPRATAKPKAVA